MKKLSKETTKNEKSISMKQILDVLRTITTVLKMVNNTLGTFKMLDNNLGKIGGRFSPDENKALPTPTNK